MTNPILIDIEEEFLTPRLRVRVARPGDGAMFNAAVNESLLHLKPWLQWARTPSGIEESEAVCRRAYHRFLLREDIMYFFVQRSDGALVGGGGLHDIDWEFRSAEIGYWGHERYCGQGLVSEGVAGVVEFGRKLIRPRRLFLTTDNRNVRSWKLAERVGFKLEGLLLNDRMDMEGNARDTRSYSFPLTTQG